MLRTFQQTRTENWLLRLAGVGVFVALMVLSSRVSFETGNPEVPFTMQVLVVLLSGMVLGARDGLFTQVIYVGLIASGLPFDTRGLGAVALFGPTGGFLIGFLPAAFIAGYLVEKAGKRFWARWLAGIAGIAVIYFFGAGHLLLYTGMDLGRVWQVGVAPFIALDMVKALMAAAMIESGRQLFANGERKR